jgi:hypothetical protein
MKRKGKILVKLTIDINFQGYFRFGIGRSVLNLQVSYRWP